tara:strand:- start:2989 stop:3294 length:306 start_codon:yes stop_codon:yes gene_type:complete
MRTIQAINKTNQKYLDHQYITGIYCKCPDCNGDIIYGAVSCPDEKYGCIACHYNYGCRSCKAVFQIIFEKDKYDDMPSEPFKVIEEIGEALINLRAIRKLK